MGRSPGRPAGAAPRGGPPPAGRPDRRGQWTSIGGAMLLIPSRY